MTPSNAPVHVDGVPASHHFAAFPVPSPGGAGWDAIDNFAVDVATRASFPMMDAVPMALQPAWRQAFAFVLDRIKGADSEAAHTRALKWLLCLPAMLLRRASRGGGEGKVGGGRPL